MSEKVLEKSIFICDFKKLFLKFNLNLESILLDNCFFNFPIYKLSDLKIIQCSFDYLRKNSHILPGFLRCGEFQ